MVPDSESDNQPPAAEGPLDCLYRVNAAVHALPADADRIELLQGACEALLEGPAFRGCWVGVPSDDGNIEYLAMAGPMMREYLDHVRIRIDETPEGTGPVGRAWRSGKPAVVADFESDPSMDPWRGAAARFGGWTGIAAFPISRDGRPWGIWVVYANVAGDIDDRTAILGRLTADTLGRELDWREAHLQAAGLRALYRALGAVGELASRDASNTDQSLLSATCEVLAESPLFRAAWLQRPDGDGWFQTLAHDGLEEGLAGTVHCNVEQHPELIVSRAWREEKLQHVAVRNAPREAAERMRQFGWGGMVAAPVRRNDAIWALLCVVTAPSSEFHRESVQLVERLARQIGHSLEHHDKRRALDESRAFYAVLANANDSLRRLPRVRDEESLLDAFCAAVSEASLFDRAFVATPRPGGGMEIRPETTRPVAAGSEAIVSASRAVAKAAWDAQAFVYSDDVREAPELAAIAGELVAVGWRGHAALPVRRGEEVWGVLTVVFPEPRGLRPEARRLLHRLAELLGAALRELDERRALEIARSRDRWLATHDALTGIGNRSVADQVLPGAIARARRSGTHIAVAYLDLDGFKAINDRDGHRRGDELLRRVAQRALAGVRETDTLVRWGGDEFLCILEGLQSDTEIAVPVQRLLELIGQPVILGGQDFQVSCSCGIALFPDDAGDADALIRCADLALYAHKTRKHDPGRPLYARYGSDVGRAPEGAA